MVMKDKKGIVELLAMCAVLVALSLLGLFSDFVTRLFDSLDGLLLLAVCLMMAGVFSVMIFLYLKDAGWLPHRSRASGEGAAGQGK